MKRWHLERGGPGYVWTCLLTGDSFGVESVAADWRRAVRQMSRIVMPGSVRH